MKTFSNTLYRGSAEDAADELDILQPGDYDGDHLRITLVNALRQIDALQKRVYTLEESQKPAEEIDAYRED